MQIYNNKLQLSCYPITLEKSLGNGEVRADFPYLLIGKACLNHLLTLSSRFWVSVCTPYRLYYVHSIMNEFT